MCVILDGKAPLKFGHGACETSPDKDTVGGVVEGLKAGILRILVGGRCIYLSEGEPGVAAAAVAVVDQLMQQRNLSRNSLPWQIADEFERSLIGEEISLVSSTMLIMISVIFNDRKYTFGSTITITSLLGRFRTLTRNVIRENACSCLLIFCLTFFM